MSNPVITKRATNGRKLFNRGLDSQRNEEILKLLRLRYSKPNDPDLAVRAQQLRELFKRVELSEAGRLYSRLSVNNSRDEISRLFWKLHRANRKKLLDILQASADKYRQTERVKKTVVELPPRTAKKRDYILVDQPAVWRDSKYIDNIADTLNRLLLFNNYLVAWQQGGKYYHFWIPEKRLITSNIKVHSIDILEPYHSYKEAQEAVTHFKSTYPQWRKWGEPVAYHYIRIGPSWIILPTLFTPSTTPNVFTAKAQFDKRYPLKAQQEGYKVMLKGYGDFLNPIPLTEVTTDGDIIYDPPDSPLDVAGEALGIKGSLPKKIPGVPLKAKKDPNIDPSLPQAKAKYRKDDTKSQHVHSDPVTPKLVSKNVRISGDTAGTGGVQVIRAHRRKDGSIRYEIEGELLPPITRNNAPNYNKDGISAKDIGLKDYEKAHMWGPGFGDEARAGITYAPREVNQKFQNKKAEDKLRQLHKMASKEGATIEVKVTAETYPRDTWKGHEVLKEVSYSFKVRHADLTTQNLGRIDISVPPPGSSKEVSVQVIGDLGGVWSLW